MKLKNCLWLLFCIFLYSSCTNLDDVNKRLDNLEEEVDDLQSALQALQTAYDDGKIVKGVSPLTASKDGWKITFSDGSSIELQNGKDGADGKGRDCTKDSY